MNNAAVVNKVCHAIDMQKAIEALAGTGKHPIDAISCNMLVNTLSIHTILIANTLKHCYEQC